MRAVVERWQPIFDWLEEKLETPLTPRDFRRPQVEIDRQQRVVPLDK